MAKIEPGTPVLARTSSNRMLERTATTGIVAGSDVPVVWVCPRPEWLAARAAGREPVAVPWPAVAVEVARVG